MVLIASVTSRNGHRGGRLRKAVGAVEDRARSAGLDVKAPSNAAEVLEMAGAVISAAAFAVALVARARSGSNGDGSNGDGSNGDGSNGDGSNGDGEGS
jgi:hypothetical protein